MEGQNTVAPEPTLGEMRVRTRFQDKEKLSNVEVLEQDTAHLINFCESGKQTALGNESKNDKYKSESARLWSLAQTAYEEAVMWAIKAETL